MKITIDLDLAAGVSNTTSLEGAATSPRPPTPELATPALNAGAFRVTGTATMGKAAVGAERSAADEAVALDAYGGLRIVTTPVHDAAALDAGAMRR